MNTKLLVTMGLAATVLTSCSLFSHTDQALVGVRDLAEASNEMMDQLKELVRQLSDTINKFLTGVKDMWTVADKNEDGRTTMWEIIMYMTVGHGAVEGSKMAVTKATKNNGRQGPGHTGTSD